MIDELRLNTKFIGFDGVIGRRDYFLNVVYICMITTLVMFPLTGFLMSNVETASDFFALNQVFYSSSIFLKLWTIIGAGIISYISISNAIRRLNDINAKVNKNMNTTLGILIALSTFQICFPTIISSLLLFINMIIGCILLFKKGAVTGKYPYDFRKEFNWGAFFGTWIWGLFNKSYKTLWMLILSLTPFGFYYSLVCGIKGNEWAYKNRKWQSDQQFKSSQETQTIVFVILSVIVLPIVYFVIILALIFALAFTVADETKASPDRSSQTLNKMEKLMESYTALYFEGHTITENENKFYVLPKDWAGYSFSDKKDVIDMAATTAASERTRNSKNKKHYSKSSELTRTKIYSSTNGELLGEFVMDETIINNEKPDFKEIVKASMNAYRFYSPTEK